MSFFQNTVLNKYLSNLDFALIEKKYSLFSGYFPNLLIQTNILNFKEKQFQEGFLTEQFVKILGFTINPHPDSEIDRMVCELYGIDDCLIV